MGALCDGHPTSRSLFAIGYGNNSFNQPLCDDCDRHKTLTPETRPSLTITESITVTETVAGTVSPTSSLEPIGTTYDGVELAQGITTILTQVPPAGYGLSGVSDVACPAEVPVKADTEFQCSLLVDGAAKAVTIQVKSDDGLYQVYPPA